jgi:hypothetical protein
MAFCTSGFKAAKNILHKLTDPLESIIDKVLAVTGSIMNGAAWPVIEGLLQSLPGGPAIDGILKTGISVLIDSKEVLSAPDIEAAYQLFLADLQKYDPLKQHAILIKYASIVVAAIHSAEILSGNIDEQPHNESTYDSLTQLKAVIINGEQKKATA